MNRSISYSGNLMTSRESFQGSTDVSLNSIVEQNYFKKIRNRLFFLFSFVDTIPSDFYMMHFIISYWRIFQFIGPSIVASYPDFWEPNSQYKSTISIISIFFHLVPPEYRSESSIIVEFAYFGILFLTFLFLIFYSFYFRKTAKFSPALGPFVTIGVNGIMHLFHPIALQMVGESIGRMIYGKCYFNIWVELAAILCTLLIYIGHLFFMIWISTVSFVFRPYSLMTVISTPQVYFSVLVALITLLSGLASQLLQIPRMVLTFVIALLYVSSIFIVRLPGSFINENIKRIITGSAVASALFLLLVIVYDIINRYAIMIEIFVFFILIIISTMIASLILNLSTKKDLMFLDNLLENNEVNNMFDQLPNLKLNQFLRCAMTGFVNSHPLCVNWSFFKQGAERFNNSLKVWRIFGKFVAIYPDESNLLSFIVHKMQSCEDKGYIIQEVISQAQTIMVQREGSLSLDLKIRLSKASKQVHVTKRKIRHIWDLAIQSTINEMDSSINNTYKSSIKAAANFNHLLAQYPNNRFVARAYSRYLLEIQGNTAMYSEWCEKVRNLQRGVMVNSDRTNVLGMNAIPNLPIHNNNNNMNTHYTESDVLNDIVELDDPISQETNEQISVLQDKIRNISIPAINCVRIWFMILYFGLIFIPTVAMLIYSPMFLDGLTEPLEYMYHLSYLRASAFELPLFAQHHLLENILSPKNSSETFFLKPYFGDLVFQSFGGSNNTVDQFRYLLTQTSNSVQKVSTYRTFANNDPNIEYVHSVVFDESIQYRFYATNGSQSLANISLQSAMMQIIYQLSEFLVSKPNLTLFNSKYITEPISNAPTVTEITSSALSKLRDYLSLKHSDIENVILFSMMFICIVYVVTIIGLLIYQVENLKITKSQIYECLTALPKNVVSSVAGSLKIIEKDYGSDDSFEDGDGENNMNKQDENILKVFSSASDLTALDSTEKVVYIILNLIILCCVIAIIVLICQMFPTFSQQLRNNAPHLDYVLGTVAYLTGSLESLETLVAILHLMDTTTERDINYLYGNMQTRLINFTDYYHYARYGGHRNDEPSYKGFQEAHDKAVQTFTCQNQIKVPVVYEDTYDCFSVDLQVNLLEPLFEMLVSPVVFNKSNLIDNHSPILQGLWKMIIKCNDQFFYPMFKEIVMKMKTSLNQSIPLYTTPAIVLLVICFVAVICIFVETIKMEDKMKFTLTLLLQCPPDVVMQTSKIMDILAGDFGVKAREGLMRHSDFFDGIVKSIPDSVIVINEQGIVESMNRATERIYGLKTEEFVGTNAKTFFMSSKFSSNAQSIFGTDVNVLNIEYKMTEQDNSFLELKSLTAKNHIVITTRDQTQNVSYNTLIAEEKSKSDKLLASILPPNLIPRVQNGEKNISFSVQSASICFMDIVEFTPWCASNTASMIMSTLNLMFRDIDSSLSKHSTLTKIKCIGDCYMAAGGIFVEVNQPAVHAKEMIEFGLEAIQDVREINKSQDLSLRIRVGVNTGGPIVAGVIGTEKPTFEILGPAINMAQQMEHHGVPMQVHISRPVYELIYSGTFNVKERGQIEIKNGSVRTYLVKGKGEL